MAHYTSVCVLLSLWMLLAIHPACARRAVGNRKGVETDSDAAQTGYWDEWSHAGDTYEEVGGLPQDPAGTKLPVDAVALEGPLQLSVKSRGLVTSQVSAASILREHCAWHAEEGTKNFDGEVLGFVTPWNGRGYDFARTFRSKFTYISPVWYQLRMMLMPEGGGGRGGPAGAGPSFSLTGGHDVDKAWLSDVRGGVGSQGARSGGREDVETKIVPRVVWEMQGSSQLSGKDLLEMARLLVDEALLRRYDGFVLDIPLSPGIEEFVSAIALTSQRVGIDLLIILTVPPMTTLTPRQLERLVPLVHRFSLTTYDYAMAEQVVGVLKGVPNSPIPWVKECVETIAPPELGGDLRQKILLGLPFYGYDNGLAITYNSVVSILKGEVSAARGGGGGYGQSAAPSVQWDQVLKEHVMTYYGQDMVQHYATYPTLAFLQERLDLARELGVGVSVWELGQGMPYFFDLL